MECLTCKNYFQLIRKDRERKFCSYLCYWDSLRSKQPKSSPPKKPAVFNSCLVCSTVFKRKRTSNTLCSRKCSGIYRSLKKKKQAFCKKCGIEFTRNLSFRGKMMFCSSKCSGAYHIKENSPSWKGGIKKDRDKRKSYDCVMWRKAVFERDNYTCQICGILGTELNADHIKPYHQFPELRSDINNGRTLCINCHRKTDTYGRKKKTTST